MEKKLMIQQFFNFLICGNINWLSSKEIKNKSFVKMILNLIYFKIKISSFTLTSIPLYFIKRIIIFIWSFSTAKCKRVLSLKILNKIIFKIIYIMLLIYNYIKLINTKFHLNNLFFQIWYNILILNAIE